jgi:excisionase family DNA binding protein
MPGKTPVFDSVDELAAEIGLSRSSTYAALKKGIIPCIRIGRRFVVSRNAVQRWLDTSPVRQVP